MNNLTADWFSHLLFDHVFDIDDVLPAFCGDHHAGRWLLCTRDGRLIAETDATDTHQIQDGDDANHWHVIAPLPVSFIEHLKNHEKLGRLSTEVQADVQSILAKCTQVHHLTQYFDQGQAGGWVRDRVKAEAMNWMDARGLIPPSMRHVREDAISGNTPNLHGNIKIVLDNSQN